MQGHDIFRGICDVEGYIGTCRAVFMTSRGSRETSTQRPEVQAYLAANQSTSVRSLPRKGALSYWLLVGNRKANGQEHLKRKGGKGPVNPIYPLIVLFFLLSILPIYPQYNSNITPMSPWGYGGSSFWFPIKSHVIVIGFRV